MAATSDGALRALERLPSRKNLHISALEQASESSEILDSSSVSKEILWLSESLPCDKPLSLEHEVVVDEFSMWFVHQTIDPAVARKDGFLLVKQDTVDAKW
eukprot:CAMPEP_0185775098 /NCGR_PEP_ID=MMETSP1174-20130828/81163_1 /TAXON_ID=35687 /ORGANISM="Dictyocha speculum, Strain CCMP1381" /LENGTH=100 /DNA_ID=CAMNT_0028462569 /DNA_START=21 /DNA_END=320 /DNA_ORIENTATION=+